jgi:hypothetical protein
MKASAAINATRPAAKRRKAQAAGNEARLIPPSSNRK